MPDHKTNKNLTLNQLNIAIDNLSLLMENKPVYVHCVASVERSPLICMAWLLKTNYLSPIESLEYMSQIHKLTNPLPGHIKILDEFPNWNAYSLGDEDRRKIYIKHNRHKELGFLNHKNVLERKTFGA